MRRSPAGPPFAPLLPWPRAFIIWRSSIPAGISTVSVAVLRILPAPWHFLQGESIIVPFPLHFGQAFWVWNIPNGVLCEDVIWPLPWQSGHVLGEVPGAAPLPWHSSQTSILLYVTSRLQPFAASSNDTVTVAWVSVPRWGALGFELPPPNPPPKILLNISPRSKSKPAPPYAPPCAPAP